MQSVLSDNEAGGHIIVLSRGDNNTLSITDEKAILEHARYYNVKFSSILVPESTAQPALPFYDAAAHASGGKAFVLTPEEGKPVGTVVYAQMLRAFQVSVRN